MRFGAGRAGSVVRSTVHAAIETPGPPSRLEIRGVRSLIHRPTGEGVQVEHLKGV